MMGEGQKQPKVSSLVKHHLLQYDFAPFSKAAKEQEDHKSRLVLPFSHKMGLLQTKKFGRSTSAFNLLWLGVGGFIVYNFYSSSDVAKNNRLTTFVDQRWCREDQYVSDLWDLMVWFIFCLPFLSG